MEELVERLGAHGQWLPFDPPDVEARTLGGLVAAGESGPRWMGYGELRSHVLGATVVTGDGRTLKLGGRVVKNVAGFDLLRPMVGSRGRLGVLTSVCVRAFPRPEEDCTLVLRADAARDLYAAALAIGTAPVMPASSVLLAPAAAVGAGAALVVRLHGSKEPVGADHRPLERQGGVKLVGVGEGGDLLLATRDQATEGVVPTVRVLPSRLGGAIDAASAALGGSDGRGAAGGVALVADTYAAAVRVAMPAVDPAAVVRLRDDVDRLGGSVSVHVAADAPGAAALVAAGSSLLPHEVELAAGLERVFDPHGAFWPCRA
jgi:glycolate oxidase FAD binding subunit